MILQGYPSFKACLNALHNKPTRFSVAREGFVVMPSTVAEVNQKYQDRLNSKAWLSMSHANVRCSISYLSELCH